MKSFWHRFLTWCSVLHACGGEFPDVENKSLVECHGVAIYILRYYLPSKGYVLVPVSSVTKFSKPGPPHSLYAVARDITTVEGCHL